MRFDPIIIVDDVVCYNFVKAQREYNKKRKKKEQIKIVIYKNKKDDKPTHTFLVKTNQDFTNVYLHICHIICIKIDNLKTFLYNEEMNDAIRRKKEEELEFFKKCEKEAEEWYIQYVIENEMQKEESDMTFVSLLQDPYDYEEYDFYTPTDIIYMTFHLAQYDREHGRTLDDFGNLLNENGEMDVTYIIDRYEKCFDVNLRQKRHQKNVDTYVKLNKDNPYIVNRILKNRDAYNNLHKAKAINKGMNIS